MPLLQIKHETSKDRETGYPKVTRINTEARLSQCRDGLEVLLHVHRQYGKSPNDHWKSTLESGSIPYDGKTLAFARALVRRCEEEEAKRRKEAGATNLTEIGF